MAPRMSRESHWVAEKLGDKVQDVLDAVSLYLSKALCVESVVLSQHTEAISGIKYNVKILYG